jgi:hypothetical protein
VLSQIKNLLNNKPKDLQRQRGVLVDRDASVEHVVRFESVTAGPADRVAFVVSFEINKNLRPADLENVVEQWANLIAHSVYNHLRSLLSKVTVLEDNGNLVGRPFRRLFYSRALDWRVYRGDLGVLLDLIQDFRE